MPSSLFSSSIRNVFQRPHPISIGWALALAIALAAWPGHAAEPDPVREGVESITARFMARVKECGQGLPYTPGVVVDSQPTLISFYFEDRSIHASRWHEMPPPIQGMLAEWAAQGTLGLTAEGQFGEVFNSLLVPHELGHFVASVNGRGKGQAFWDGEVYANRVAIAFWKGEPGGEAKLSSRLENYNRFLDGLPNPVPDGQQPRAWFEANYEELGNNPQAYGWYQGLFMREASQQSADDEFCSLIGSLSR